MRITLTSSTSRLAGSIIEEAVGRGHVIAHFESDRADETLIVASLRDTEVLVCAAAPWPVPGAGRRAMDALVKTLIAALRAAGRTRLVMVGGAGTVELDPDFPPYARVFPRLIAEENRAVALLQGESAWLDWTRVGAAAVLQPGARQGSYRMGSDAALRDFRSHSAITYADLAVAMIDEVERARFVRQVVSVAW